MKKILFKKKLIILPVLCLVCCLCSCSKAQTMSKQGNKFSVKLSGLGTKTLVVSISGEISEEESLITDIPSYFDMTEDEDGNIFTEKVPFFETVKNELKNKKAVSSFKALSSGICTLRLSLSSDGIHNNMLVRLELDTDDDLNISCKGIYLCEEAQYNEFKIDDNTSASLETGDGSYAKLSIINSSDDISIEGYDFDMIEISDSGNYDSVSDTGFAFIFSPVNAGECSVTLIDKNLHKRYIAGIIIEDDVLNADVSEGYIITLDSIISENYSGGSEDEEGDQNEYKG